MNVVNKNNRFPSIPMEYSCAMLMSSVSMFML